MELPNSPEWMFRPFPLLLADSLDFPLVFGSNPLTKPGHGDQREYGKQCIVLFGQMWICWWKMWRPFDLLKIKIKLIKFKYFRKNLHFGYFQFHPNGNLLRRKLEEFPIYLRLFRFPPTKLKHFLCCFPPSPLGMAVALTKSIPGKIQRPYPGRAAAHHPPLSRQNSANHPYPNLWWMRLHAVECGKYYCCGLRCCFDGLRPLPIFVSAAFDSKWHYVQAI